MAWNELPGEDKLAPMYRSSNGWLLCYFRILRHEWVLFPPDGALAHTNTQLSSDQVKEAQAWAESLMQDATGSV
jgi:hypothetical protein